MKDLGKLFAILYLVSPFLMVVFGLAGWEPFASLAWYWKFSPWLYMLFVVLTVGIIEAARDGKPKVTVNTMTDEQMREIMEKISKVEGNDDKRGLH